jgi:hypothetical protein
MGPQLIVAWEKPTRFDCEDTHRNNATGPFGVGWTLLARPHLSVNTITDIRQIIIRQSSCGGQIILSKYRQNVKRVFGRVLPELHWLSPATYRMVLKVYLNTFPDSLTDLQDENHAVII